MVRKHLNVSQLTADKCKNCYAMLHCSMCQGHSDDNGKFTAERRLSYCKSSRNVFDSKIKNCILLKETKTKYTWRP